MCALLSPTQSNAVVRSNAHRSLLITRPRQRRPDRAVYVPRGRRSQTTPPIPLSQANTAPAANESHSSHSGVACIDHHSPSEHGPAEADNRFAHTDQRATRQFVISVEGESVENNCDQTAWHSHTATAALSDKDIYSEATIPATVATKMSSHQVNQKNQCNINSNNSNDSVPETRTSDKDYNEDKEFQRASKVRLSLATAPPAEPVSDCNTIRLFDRALSIGNQSQQSPDHQTDIQ